MSPDAPSPATRLIALLGDPVAHSLSPRFQNAAFRAAAVDGVYLALRCDAATLPGLLLGIARAGGGGNVTVPHKSAAADVVQEAAPAVRRTGACNTFWLERDRVHGDNTDVAGFAAAVDALIGSPAGARVLLLGAGGAARAALCGLLDAGADAVTILNRSSRRAAALVDAFVDPPAHLATLSDPDVLAGETFDLVVNATSLGLHPGDPLPFDLALLGRAGAALDLVYGPCATRWVESARALGIPAADGTEMLLQQGAAAFERWWSRPAPVAAMRAALLQR